MGDLQLLLFPAASLVIIAVPGQDMALVVSRPTPSNRWNALLSSAFLPRLVPGGSARPAAALAAIGGAGN